MAGPQNEWILDKGPPVGSLYKFRAFDPDRIEFAKDILLNHRLYAPSPSALNDPFDCTGEISVEASAEEVDARVRRRILEESPGIQSKEVEKLLPARRDEILANGPLRIREFVNSHGIVSFSRRNDQHLLWSHYASAHTGICIEFSLPIQIRSSHLDFFARALPVVYSEKRATPNFITGELSDIAKSLVLTKSTDWNYEEESRHLVANVDKNRFLQFRPELVSRVYLGCRMSQEHRKLVLQWLAQRGAATRPNVYQAVPSRTEYKLEFQPAST